MSKSPTLIDEDAVSKLAIGGGVAISIVDGPREIFTANNNSICRVLNPDGRFVGHCESFCGTALEEVTEVGSRVSFTCHAGLECRVIPVENAEKPLVAIIGRTFIKAENYRKATERAISGDWRDHSARMIFENVLFSGSSDGLDNTVAKMEKLVSKSSAVAGKATDTISYAPEPKVVPVDTEQISITAVPEIKIQPVEPPIRAADVSAWRSFFGSMLEVEYPQAANSILEFLAFQFGFESLIWMENLNGTFETTATFGGLKDRKVRLGISPSDQRLIDAANHDSPLELGEKKPNAPDTPARVLNLFPITLGGEIFAAIAVLDAIDKPETKHQIVHLCKSLAPQLEILRLRNEVARREILTSAVRAFNTSLKKIDADDLWLSLAQISAQMLSAERASLMIYNERSDRLDIKAIVGAARNFSQADDVGQRVARVVFERGEAALISDVSCTGLPPLKYGRGYKTKSFLSCPINIGGRNIGVMNFTDRSDRSAFDKNSLRLFLAIAPQLAIAIDRATLKDRVGKFEQLSVTDPLTGLLNRRYIEARLLEEVKRSNRHGFPMSFLMLDVDHFKSYNDQFGHPAGDQALRLVGNVIRETLRGADVAARFGGEEFSILLPQTTSEEAVSIAERIRRNIERTQFPHRPVTSSIGIASCSAELCVSEDLIAAADKALYEAKRLGRNRVQVFEG